MKTISPVYFELQTSTVWSFPRRGNWATHNSKYRGNWSPDVVRNLILRYSKEGDYLLDPMIGGGTTAVECKLLNRNLLAYDINPNAIELTKKALDFEIDSETSSEGRRKKEGQNIDVNGLLRSSQGQKEEIEGIDFSTSSKGQKIDSEINSEGRKEMNKIKLELRNATEKNEQIKDESIDFVLNHPPYVDIIKYSDGIEGDLSQIHDLEKFCNEYEKVIKELYRVLKPGKFCAILIGDTRREKMYQPLAFMILQKFLNNGFALKEDIVKVQHNCKATGYWKTNSIKYNFLLIMHEHLFIFQK